MEFQFMYEKFIQGVQHEKYLLQIYNVNSLLYQLSCIQELQGVPPAFRKKTR